MTDNELNSLIERNLTAAKKIKTDAGEVEQHSITDQIAAFEYLKKKRSLERIKTKKRGAFGFVGTSQIVKEG